MEIEFECEEGYPTEESIERLRDHKFDPFSSARFIVNDLQHIKQGISCVFIEVEDTLSEYQEEPEKTVSYSTGGWSGAEELISTMLRHFWIRHYHASWERGGHYVFRVPTANLTKTMPAP